MSGDVFRVAAVPAAPPRLSAGARIEVSGSQVTMAAAAEEDVVLQLGGILGNL